MRKIFRVESALDPLNYLKVYPNGGGDYAFRTERYNPDNEENCIFQMAHNTLRTGMGGGKYATLSKRYRSVDDLHYQFIKLYGGVIKEDMSFPVRSDDYALEDKTVKVITFTSDDGGLTNHANILNADGIIGLENFEVGAEKEKVTVWLGNCYGDSKEAQLLNDMWTAAVEFCQFIKRYSEHKGMEFKKTKYNELNL